MTDPANWHRRSGGARSGEIVIFDLDGVMSDASPRQVHLRGGVLDWDAFFAAGVHDEPLDAGITLAQLVNLPIVVLTARPHFVQADTVDWLKRHGVPFDLVITRPEADSRSSVDFKQAEVESLRRAGYNIALAVDDDPSNVEMYRSCGVEAVYVYSGYYDIDLG